MPQNCSICSKPAASFNYGVFSCNACKMFFRRASISNRPKSCKNGGKCSKIDNSCRKCRFQWCLEAGMRLFNLTKPFKNPESSSDITNLSLFIKHLTYLDSYRKSIFSNCCEIEGGICNLEEAINRSIKFISDKEPGDKNDKKYTCQDWDLLEHFSCIDFLKKMEFMPLLEASDQSILLKNMSYKFKILSTAYRSLISDKSDKMIFPGGMDIFIPEVLANYRFSGNLLQNIRCRIIAKFIDLRVKEEEFLLIGVLFFCNPDVPALSHHSCSTLTKFRQIYTSALFQYCLITYPNSGPTRFSDLLSIITAINATWEDITSFTLLFRFYHKEVKLKQVLEDVIDNLEAE